MISNQPRGSSVRCCLLSLSMARSDGQEGSRLDGETYRIKEVKLIRNFAALVNIAVSRN
jgi:hypothetical protein